MSRLFLIVKGDALLAEAAAVRHGFEVVAESRDFGWGRTRVEVAEVDESSGVNAGRFAARWLGECPTRAPIGGYPDGTLLYYDTVRENPHDTGGVPEFVVDVVD